jgi:hypothetical protein
MRRLAALVFTGALGALTLGLGCSSDNTEPPAGTGGAPGSGGKPAGSGGMQATGSGGHVGTGGVPNVGVGGSGTGGMNAGSGGMPNSGTGGDHSTGGVSGGSGGHVGTGGVPNPGSGGSGTDGGTTNCVGRAISLSANGTGTASDSALARVEIDLASDLPIGNSQRTVEFWAFIKTTDWVGDKNEVYYYGGTANATAFGLEFGTNPVMGMANNHATLNPVTAGGFNDDSTNDLGINSSTDQWVHIAMVWNGTNVITYVNGLPKITTAGNGVTALATTQSVQRPVRRAAHLEGRAHRHADPRQLQQARRDQRDRPGGLLEVRRDLRHHHGRRRHRRRPHRAQRHAEGGHDRPQPDVRRAADSLAARLPLRARATGRPILGWNGPVNTGQIGCRSTPGNEELRPASGQASMS